MLDPTTISLTLIGVFVIAFMKGGFGGGFAIVGIPLLALVMDLAGRRSFAGPIVRRDGPVRIAVLEADDLVETGPEIAVAGTGGRHRSGYCSFERAGWTRSRYRHRSGNDHFFWFVVQGWRRSCCATPFTYQKRSPGVGSGLTMMVASGGPPLPFICSASAFQKRSTPEQPAYSLRWGISSR